MHAIYCPVDRPFDFLNSIFTNVKPITENAFVRSKLAIVFLFHWSACLFGWLNRTIHYLRLSWTLWYMRVLMEHTPCISSHYEITKCSLKRKLVLQCKDQISYSHNNFLKMVGKTGLEPATPCSQSRWSTTWSTSRNYMRGMRPLTAFSNLGTRFVLIGRTFSNYGTLGRIRTYMLVPVTFRSVRSGGGY